MRKSKFSESQIISILNEAEAGQPVKEVCRKHGISPATYYKWKAKYGGLGASELKRIKELEAENNKLKRLYADMALENTGRSTRTATSLNAANSVALGQTMPGSG